MVAGQAAQGEVAGALAALIEKQADCILHDCILHDGAYPIALS